MGAAYIAIFVLLGCIATTENWWLAVETERTTTTNYRSAPIKSLAKTYHES